MNSNTNAFEKEKPGHWLAVVFRFAGILCGAYLALRIEIASFVAVFALMKRDGLSWMGLGDLSLLFLNAIFAFPFGWLAWRLWRCWDAMAVRWLVGAGVAAGLVYTHAWLIQVRGKPVFATANLTTVAVSVAPTLLLIIGGLIYRYITRRTIRLAALCDELDAYGQPIGHQTRIRALAFVLGWSIFLIGPEIEKLGQFSGRPDSWISGVVMFGPAILGYSTYKLMVWMNKPRTTPSLPEGGFEVITCSVPVP